MAARDEKNTLEKSPSKTKVTTDDDVRSIKSVTVGEVVSLDAGEVFLREHKFSDAYLAELLSDHALNKRLVRKIDLMVLPLLAGTYVLQYIDKQAMSYAAVFDLFTSTGITSDQYAWFASIFYLAYLVAEYPWMWLAQKTRMAKVVTGCVIAWGFILMVTAACQNFAGLAACRFMLGVFEAPITTCFMMMVAMWYTRPEQPFRAGIFYCCNGVGSMVGGILNYGIGQIQTFPVWKAVFLLCGGVTVIWGLVLWVFLPDDILTAKRFTTEEKALLIARGRLAKTGILFVLLNETINGGIANFGKLIIKGLVSDPLLTTALGIPQGAFQVVWILSGTWAASHFKNARTIVMALYLIPTIVGLCLIWKLDRTTFANKIGVLFGYYMSGAFVTALVLALQMPSTNLGGYTKRTASTALVFLAYCVGNIIGPHAFLAEEAPLYQTGCILIIACAVAQMCISVVLRMLLISRNTKRDEADAAAEGAAAEGGSEGVDLTDFENPHFRYVDWHSVFIP